MNWISVLSVILRPRSRLSQSIKANMNTHHGNYTFSVALHPVETVESTGPAFPTSIKVRRTQLCATDNSQDRLEPVSFVRSSDFWRSTRLRAACVEAFGGDDAAVKVAGARPWARAERPRNLAQARNCCEHNEISCEVAIDSSNVVLAVDFDCHLVAS